MQGSSDRPADGTKKKPTRKLYTCQECDKAFHWPSQYISHLKTHSGMCCFFVFWLLNSVAFALFKRERERQTDRQADKQRQTDRKTDRHKDSERERERQTDRERGRKTDRQMQRQKDRG